MAKSTPLRVQRRDERARFLAREPMHPDLAAATREFWLRVVGDMALAGFSARTQSAYLLSLRDFVEFHGQAPSQFEQEEVRAWVGILVSRGLSASRLRQHFSALRFAFCRTLGRPSAVSFLGWPVADTRSPVVLTRVEVARLLEHVRDPKYRVLFSLMYATGMRLAEACQLEARDLDIVGGVVRVRQSKGSRPRVAPLHSRLWQMLEAYRKVARPNGHLLFGSRHGKVLSPGVVRSAVRRAGLDAGIAPKVTPHALRHAFAAHLLEAGVDVRVLQVALGHRSIRTTIRYAHVPEALIARLPSPLDWLA